MFIKIFIEQLIDRIRERAMLLTSTALIAINKSCCTEIVVFMKVEKYVAYRIYKRVIACNDVDINIASTLASSWSNQHNCRIIVLFITVMFP